MTTPTLHADPMPPAIRIVVVQCAPDFAALIAPSPRITIEAFLPLSDEALPMLKRIAPHVIVLDLRATAIADIDAIESVIRSTRQACASAALVVVGPPAAEALASRALVAGASAYEGSGMTPLGLLRAIHAAASGRLHLSPTGRRAAQKLTRSALGNPE